MTESAKHNFHLPMPARLYRDLRTEAERRGIPATVLARRVLEDWLEERRRLAVAEAISAYAAQVAGTRDDLDPELEAAAVAAMPADSES